MRILFVSPAAELGGAERCLLDCIASLRESGAAVEVQLLSFTDGPLLEKARALGAATQVILPPLALTELGESRSRPQPGTAAWTTISAVPSAARFLAQLRAVMASARPDVVHTNGMKAHLLAGAVAPAGTGLIVHLHDFIGARRASKWLLPALSQVRRKTLFIANSNAVARDFRRLAPHASVRTVYNVVDTDYFAPGNAEPGWLAARAELPPPIEGTITFGLVATYARWKGHGLFIEAAGLLQAAHPDLPLRFYVVGGPIYKTIGSQVHTSELLQRARQANIQASFGLSPFQEDVARVYRSLNVVVHSSTQPEPFGRAIIEAMACARTAVVARAGGAEELFQHDKNAIGYEPNNTVALAEAMMLALQPERRHRLEHAARDHAVAYFARSRLAPALIQVYEESIVA